MGEAAPRKLTQRQRRFVEEYAADGNAVQAYFRAFGCNTSRGRPRNYKAAQSSASVLLSNPLIQAELEAANNAHARRIAVSKERVLAEVAAIAFADPDDTYEPDEQNAGLPVPKKWRDIPPMARKAIQSVKVKRRRLANDHDETAWEIEEIEYRFHSKTDALHKLCKKLGFYEVEAEATGGDPFGVSVDVVTRILAALGARQLESGTESRTAGESVTPDALGSKQRPAE